MSELTDETVRADLAEQAATIVARYPEGRSRSALLPMLHLVQSVDGYVSPEGIAFCAEQLGITKAEVAAVATFYTMYKRRPTGEYLVSVCTNTMCGVLGGDKAYEALSAYLEVGHDQTTEDGRITLEHAECLAACDYAPVMTVNYEYFDQVDADSALSLVKQLQDGERPMPTRGARLCSFKEMSRQLAGFAEARNGAVADPMTDFEPTVAGNRLAEERGVSVPGFFPNTPIPRKADQDAKPTPTKAAPAKAASASPAAKAAAASTDEGPKTAEPPATASTTPAAETPPAATSTAPAASKTPAAEAPAGPPAATSTAPAAEAPAEAPAATTAPAADAPAADGPAGDAPGADVAPPAKASRAPRAPRAPRATKSTKATPPKAAPAASEPAEAGGGASDEDVTADKPAPRPRRRSGPLVSATADPAKRRPANKAPAKRGGTRRPTNRDPETERSAPAVEQADATPAQPATDPQVKDLETPTNPAETSPTVPEPSADSKPAGDAPPTDPRTENEGQK
ncbi:NADH-quinone oxidoreductase subunit NuoE [Cryptosporangium aurantiacum]|uniref:NADH-quinone oxidoreductase subunit E n=1 Tax=Cryptosporangium aurantiacum TaxID=134849 RepID=A0A1M7RHA7_9ACTN|nr:NADH-quinone oxidoreductase subunit NuoE [Cryptosporangium aurantiacum]SHN45541.1 NADH-quinone oxidoreductase subunit E [Cryptosporangium aurantiacum]